MIIKLILGVIVTMVLWAVIRRWHLLGADERKSLLKRWAIPVVIGVFVLLALTGHLNWIFAAAASLFALGRRLIPYLRYLPMLSSLGQARANAAQSDQTRTDTTDTVSDMNVEKAQATLGVGPDANREDIIRAHRHLIQKIHPDRGGPAYLAGQINQARDVLLAAIEEREKNGNG